MQELLSFARELGFDLPPVLDGAVHRFPHAGSKDAGWMIGFQNHSVKDGTPYVVAVFGSWKTREDHIYKPAKSSREDKRAIDEAIDKARRVQAEAKAQAQLDAADKAGKRWQRAGDVFESEYLTRKKVDALYGAKTWLADAGRVVTVPMRDVEGKLWGAQNIFPDGTKRFATGMKVEGCFHLIGDMTDAVDAFICEGFATGASLHMATGKPVVVAFNSGNLLPVSKCVKAKWSEVQFTIAGDEDQWTIIKGEQVNRGRIDAERAALSCMGATVFPRFADLDGKPTDFNDLHCREGLAAVKIQLTAEAVGEIENGFIPLGFDEGAHYFYSMKAKDIIHTSNFQETSLLCLAPLAYWTDAYTSKVGINWQKARDDLIQASQSVGPFDNFRIRGTGVWLDDGRTVINTGRSLLVDGKVTAMGKHRSRFVYIQTKNRLPPLHASPLTVDDAKALIDVARMFKWRDSKSSYFLCGWIAVARIAGALPIRPHVWLTGGAHTGKSTVMADVISPALGCPAGKLYLQGGSTEAGIRQMIKADSRPPIFDEFETNDERTGMIVDGVTCLMRQSWSATQGSIVKGSAGGQAVQYQLAFAGLVSSIRVNLTNDADRSRFAVLELAPHGSDLARWEVMRQAIDGITEDLGERLFARSAGMVKTILANYKAFAAALATVVNQRFGQQYGMLLAGYWSLVSDAPATKEDARDLVASMDFGEEKIDAELTDELEAAQRILQTKIQLRDGGGFVIDRSIGEIIAGNLAGELIALQRFGIKIESGFMIVANQHPELTKIFAGTHWVKGWSKTLRRLGGKPTVAHNWGDAGKSRAVSIPLTAIDFPSPVPKLPF